jgi:hypothetical protein
LTLPINLKKIDGRAFEDVLGVISMKKNDSFYIEKGFLRTKVEIIRRLKIDRQIYIPKEIEMIGIGCFSKYEFEFEVFLGMKVRIIKRESFKNSKVGKIEIPQSVEEIEAKAFENCKRLKEIEIANNSKLKIVGEMTFSESGLEKMRFLGESKLERIGNFAFSGSEMTEFIFPKSVKELGIGVFSSTNSLTEIVFERGIELLEIPSHSFAKSSLQRIELPKSIKSIGNCGFSNARFLKEVKFPNSLEFIGNSAFCNTSLREVSFIDSLKSIGNFVFSGCRFLSIVRFTNVTSLEFVGFRAFSGTRIHSNSLPSNFNFRDGSIFETLYDETESGYLIISNGIVIKAIGRSEQTIPSNVSAIGRFAFVNFGFGVHFSETSELISIGESAFENSQLITITIPISVRIIESSAFRGSHQLSSVIFYENSSLEVIENYAFSKTNLIELTLPNKLERFSGSSVDQLNRISVLRNERFEVFGNFLLKSKSTILVKAFGESVKLEIPATVEIIESYGFSGLRTLTEVIFPNGLTRIERSAFSDTSIRILELPSTLLEIDPRAFEGIEIVLWNPKHFVIENALNYEGVAKSILLSEKMDILIRSFARARRIIIPSSVEEIGIAAFSGISSLRTVECETGSRLKIIREEAFVRSGLLTIELPPSLEIIKAEAIPLFTRIELESGLRNETAEEEFDIWIAMRKAGFDVSYPIH